MENIMSVSYTYNPNWVNRDAQPDGSALRVVKAADFESEWVAIQNSFAQCAPAASPTFTGAVSVTGTLAVDGTLSTTGSLSPASVASTGAVTGSNLNVDDWDTAFGWGDHAAAGYASNTGYNNANWDIAFGWGNHASAGYALSANVPSNTGTGASGTWGINITGNAANAYFANTATDCSRSITGTGNLTGGGAMTANRTISMVAEPSLTSVILGNFKITDSGTNLYFSYNGNNILRLSSAGELLAENNVGAYVSV
jgi:hypothetical protein